MTERGTVLDLFESTCRHLNFTIRLVNADVGRFAYKSIRLHLRVWALTFLEQRMFIVFRLQGRRNISDRVGDQL